MIILDPFRLQQYWDSIAQGFQKSPLELLLSVVVIIVLLSALITLLVLFLKREKRRRIGKARQAFDRALGKKKLTVGEQELLLAMADALPKGKESAVASLLSDPSLFNSAARRLQEGGRMSAPQTAALKKKLGLVRPGSQGILHYSQELEEGTPVALRMRDGKEYDGLVVGVDSRSFSVTTAAPARAGQNVVLQVFRPGGLYSLVCRVNRASAGTLAFEHATQVDRVQKRRYFRKMLRLPIYVKPLEPDEPVVKTRLVDLGGGGARFLGQSGLGLKENQSLLIIFRPEKAERLTIKSRVTRISEDDGTVSVAFETLRESTRDRIMRLVLR